MSPLTNGGRSATREDGCGGTSPRTSSGQGEPRPAAAPTAAGQPRRSVPRADGHGGTALRTSCGEGGCGPPQLTKQRDGHNHRIEKYGQVSHRIRERRACAGVAGAMAAACRDHRSGRCKGRGRDSRGRPGLSRCAKATGWDCRPRASPPGSSAPRE